MTDCWYSRVEDKYQKFDSGEINSKRKLTKLRETIAYDSLARIGTQVDDYRETKNPKQLQR